MFPGFGNVGVRSGQPKICRIIEFQDGSCLYVTAAVKAASHFGRAQGDHSGQSTFEVRWNLRSPPSSPFPPPFFLCILDFS